MSGGCLPPSCSVDMAYRVLPYVGACSKSSQTHGSCRNQHALRAPTRSRVPMKELSARGAARVGHAPKWHIPACDADLKLGALDKPGNTIPRETIGSSPST
jgi:hypothetical protein